MMVLLILLFVLTLFASAFFSGAETGFSTLNRGRVLYLARAGSVKAKILHDAISDLSRTITTLLLGNNFMNVAYSSLSAALAVRIFPTSAVAQTLWSIGAAILVLCAGEFLPKLFCSARPLRRMLRLAPFYRLTALILAPFTQIAVIFTSLFVPRKAPRLKTTIYDLERILTDRKDGVKLTDFESSLIGRILVLRKKRQPVTAEALLQALDEH